MWSYLLWQPRVNKRAADRGGSGVISNIQVHDNFAPSFNTRCFQCSVETLVSIWSFIFKIYFIVKSQALSRVNSWTNWNQSILHSCISLHYFYMFPSHVIIKTNSNTSPILMMGWCNNQLGDESSRLFSRTHL